jgi:AraC-like DNA-binding protein
MYVREMTGEKYQKRNSWFLHFLPAMLILMLFIPLIYIMPSNVKIQIAMCDQEDYLNGNPSFVTIFILIQIALYFIWVFVVLLRYSKRLKENYSALERRNLDWLKILIGINLLIWIVFIFAIYTSSSIVKILYDLSFPFAIYILGYLGLMQVDLESERTTIISNSEVSLESVKQNNAAPDKKSDESANRYVRSSLTSEKAEILRQKLDTFMLNEKSYLEDDLNLRELADRLEVFPHHLSQLLNEHYGQNFFDYINSFRIQEVKIILVDPSQKDETILAIAFSCGFKSKATFNSFFKKHTGQTPRHFRAQSESQKAQSIYAQ